VLEKPAVAHPAEAPSRPHSTARQPPGSAASQQVDSSTVDDGTRFQGGSSGSGRAGGDGGSNPAGAASAEAAAWGGYSTEVSEESDEESDDGSDDGQTGFVDDLSETEARVRAFLSAAFPPSSAYRAPGTGSEPHSSAPQGSAPEQFPWGGEQHASWLPASDYSFGAKVPSAFTFGSAGGPQAASQAGGRRQGASPREPPSSGRAQAPVNMREPASDMEVRLLHAPRLA
jgi:hypothetical protein